MVLCGVCFNQTSNVTECGHYFCRGCLTRWGGGKYWCYLCEGVHCGAGRRGEWFDYQMTCPMCRQIIKVVDYPNTRSSGKVHIASTRLRGLLGRVEKCTNIIQRRRLVARIMIYMWKERVVFRRCRWFTGVVRKQATRLVGDYRKYNITPPEVLALLVDF